MDREYIYKYIYSSVTPVHIYSSVSLISRGAVPALVDTIREGDPVLLLEEGEEARKHLLRAGDKVDRFRGIGVFDPRTLIGKRHGDRIHHGDRSFVLLPPTTADLVETLERKAQIVLAKDAGPILLHCGVIPGATVVESGVGSGALTLALASAVGEKGRVIAYELRDDFAEVARRNVARAGMAERVEVRIADVRQGIAERGVHAVILDIPDPWEAVPAAASALRIGGVLACYSPLVSQVEKAVAAMREHRFLAIRTTETLERAWVVGERGSRPAFEMLGHTGYVTTGRRGPAPPAG